MWGEHTLASSRAHPATLQVLLVASVLAAVLVLPSLALLFSVFSRRAKVVTITSAERTP